MGAVPQRPARRWLQTLVLLLLAAGTAGAIRFIQRDPAADVVRVRLAITSRASSVIVTTQGAVITNASVEDVNGGLRERAVFEGGRVGYTGNIPGLEVEASFRVTLARVRGSGVTFRTDRAGPGSVTLDVTNLNVESMPRAVDRFSTGDRTATFTSSGAELRADGPLEVASVGPRLVLAHYYPWFDRSTWTSPLLADRPQREYSTEEPADVQQVFGTAAQAGLDGLVVSWQGLEFQGGWNHRRMQLALEAAQQANIRVATLLETTVANPEHRQTGVEADPRTVQTWISDIVRSYGSHPAYLRVGDRPVIFVYSVPRLRVAQWEQVVAGVRASGPQPMLVGDATRSVWLPSFDGQFDYASNRLAIGDIAGFQMDQGNRVRTYHLLGNTGRRRIWAATVSPGYDDRALAATDGRTPRVSDRQQGAYYDAQWRAAFAAGADWVVVTSWNEWWENTHIEPSVNYGDFYLRRTKVWAARFRAVTVQ
jgi:glycoprotein endo-alpha-1,2-mannosidase